MKQFIYLFFERHLFYDVTAVEMILKDILVSTFKCLGQDHHQSFGIDTR